MMDNMERNIRTLIICFVLALVALVPLRMMEGNGSFVDESRSVVLGDSDVVEEVIVVDDGNNSNDENAVIEEVIPDNEVVLPDADNLE